jgi:hypothetical protein
MPTNSVESKRIQKARRPCFGIANTTFSRFVTQIGVCACVLLFPYAALADAYADLSAAERATVNSRSYHFSSTGPNTRTEGDLAYPDVLHETMQNGTEIIIVGGAIYVRSGGKWAKNPPALVSLRTAISPKHILAQLTRKKYRIADLGMQNFDNVPMHAYRITEIGNANDFWNGVAFVDKAGRFVAAVSHGTTFRISSFGERVHIAAPL